MELPVDSLSIGRGSVKIRVVTLIEHQRRNVNLQKR